LGLSGLHADSVYALGIHFSNDANLLHKLNFHGKLEKVEKILNSWRRRKLNLYGKISIIKTLGLSKLIFSASVLPIPENFAQEVNKLTFKFLWDARPAKIKKSTITGLKEKGGLKMIDFEHMNKALKCAGINRLINGNKGAWKIIPDNTTAHLGRLLFPSSVQLQSQGSRCEKCTVFLRKSAWLHAWRARLILIQTKHSSGTTNTLKSTIKLCFFQLGTTKESTKLKI